MRDEHYIQKDFEAGKIPEDAYFQILDGINEQFLKEAQRILEPKEFQLISGDNG